MDYSSPSPAMRPFQQVDPETSLDPQPLGSQKNEGDFSLYLHTSLRLPSKNQFTILCPMIFSLFREFFIEPFQNRSKIFLSYSIKPMNNDLHRLLFPFILFWIFLHRFHEHLEHDLIHSLELTKWSASATKIKKRGGFKVISHSHFFFTGFCTPACSGSAHRNHLIPLHLLKPQHFPHFHPA